MQAHESEFSILSPACRTWIKGKRREDFLPKYLGLQTYLQKHR